MRTTPIAAGWGVLVACLWLAGCSPDKGVERTMAETRFDDNKSLFAAIRDADKATLYEGLPHQSNEAKLLEKEKKEKKTVQLHGFPFYQETLELKADDRKSLQKVLGDSASFQQWGVEKKCGGFHPDYLVEWRVGDKEYRVLICFGCHEVKVFGPDKTLRCDMAGETKKALQDVLKTYQKNRPARQDD
jgi:hypothetical protein